ncbi:MAG: hypothetical protein IIC20_06100 [Chloroflexi bacterium]|nr:hypothetical protein [Chloroflexota bacterium]
MAEALRWYAALLLIGGAGLLPAGVLFARLHSRGLLYARPIAMLLVAQIVWLAAALTSLSYGTALVLAAVLALWAWSAALAWRRPALLRGLRERWRLLLGGELLFLVLFLLLVLVRAQSPAATGTEKPMDLALLTAVHETSSFPPADPWLAGADIAYYHLGHTMVDAIGRLAGTPPAITFNMGVAAVGAMAAVAVFGLAGDVLALSRPKHRWAPLLAGGIALLSFLILAPLEGLMEIAAANGLGGQSVWGRLGVEGLPGPAEATAGVPDAFFWWWSATRVLPGTITEFPAFSIILGDLHAHLLALPLGITALALAVVTFDGTTPLGWRRWLRFRLRTLLIAITLATIAFAWCRSQMVEARYQRERPTTDVSNPHRNFLVTSD